MRHRHLVLLVVPLAAGACAQVLGLDEPTVKGEGAGGASTSAGSPTGATTGGSSSTVTGAGGDGGGGRGGGPQGGGGSGGCSAHLDCDDDNPCTIDVCTDGTCVNEASGTQPDDDLDDCVDVTCAGDVPTFTPDDTEDAADPAPPCLTAVCQDGVAVPVEAAAGTTCGLPPLECDGRGQCIGCEVDEQCVVEGPCAVAVCLAEGACEVTLLEQGAVVADDEENCKAATCTGQSAVPDVVYDADDLPAPITCAEVSCAPSGPRIERANDGVPCMVGDFEGVCDGETIGDDACVQCDGENDCELHPGGERCFAGPGVCGCTFGGDCQEYWRAGSACLTQLSQGVCGCGNAAHCSGNMHGAACVDERCGCAIDADCAGAALGDECIAGTATCGCVVDADCTTSPLGEVCMPDDRCGCLDSTDCPQGSSCFVAGGFCVD